MSDWKYAVIAALVLLGAAVFIVFVIHPGGFEGQMVWFAGLLPGVLIGATVADRVYKIAPSVERITYWTFTLGISLLWYIIVIYVVIKTSRFVSSRL